MARIKTKWVPGVINAKKKKIHIGLHFKPKHMKIIQKERLEQGLKDQSKAIKRTGDILEKTRKIVQRSNPIRILGEMKLSKQMSTYSEIRWKLLQVQIGELQAKIANAPKRTTQQELMRSYKQIEALKANQKEYENCYTTFSQAAEDLERKLEKRRKN